ncbi:hypothetical protein [Mongoliitalea daihaiensis]|uniref:hypothetical protein n=1 Tax=Mongoliitalea daihaiensis TaxID=2782006 RepID=UPI001F3BA46E|nr:hypothetical protein [Mongoliitalea daihaiensis]UJP65952.1 hypothetical protein IPZ59_04830 [Mongoliitalea daihaiensis]
MKKLFIGLAFLGSVLMFNKGVRADESLPENQCLWKRQSCGLFQGSFEACLVNGDGMPCSCGEVTRNC